MIGAHFADFFDAIGMASKNQSVSFSDDLVGRGEGDRLGRNLSFDQEDSEKCQADVFAEFIFFKAEFHFTIDLAKKELVFMASNSVTLLPAILKAKMSLRAKRGKLIIVSLRAKRGNPIKKYISS